MHRPRLRRTHWPGLAFADQCLDLAAFVLSAWELACHGVGLTEGLGDRHAAIQ
jgi:hypothetical protein